MERFDYSLGIPQVVDLMTPFPHTIADTELVSVAKAMFARHGVRHFPVVGGEELVGILTERDLKLAQAVYKNKNFDSEVVVGDVCERDVYVVASNTPLNEVLRHMVRVKIGSALVTRGDELVGIFTSTDACHFFADFLEVNQEESS